MKRLVFFALSVWLGFAAQAANNSRSDTFTVQHYEIDLDISNISSHNISGYCVLHVQSKINLLSVLKLDLLKLNIDSITLGTYNLVYQYNDTLMQVMLPYNLNAGDTATLAVYYHGHPVTDASWGGFYFSGNYAYNMGVGFSADPHNFGRVWFPCIDNFVDKAYYDFYITTAPTNRAMCNGLLKGQSTDVNGNITWHWQTKHPLPTYLASVAVSNYQPRQYTYHGISDSFPVVLSPPPSDTAKILASFIHLNNIIAGYEQAYGPQPFAKVGFTEVPFTGGAMEHAGNISYPVFAVDGTTNYEDLYAHELSHHWFGDMVTCETAEDMWLNEGWASYSAIYTQDFLYGKDAYKKAERENHIDVLQYAYVKDGGYRAVYGIPHDYTYGEHVYKKGADVAHTLRGYLGDSLFFSSLKYHLHQHAYANSNSNQFRDDLTAASGMDMTPFFNDWVFNPGFPHFSIDSFTTAQNGGSNSVTVYIRQKLKQAPHYYTNVPIEVTYMDAAGHKATHTTMMSGNCGIYTSQLAFAPTFVALDMEEKISDATTDKYLYVDSVGTYDFEEALMTMNVTSVTDSALVRVEHNWVYPDPPKTVIPGLHISQERYWKVDGIWPAGFAASATVSYNGTASTSGGYLDNQLITASEDSLVMLYRASAADDWAIDTSVTLSVQGSTTNKKGSMVINQIRKGEYAFAIWDHGRADSNVVLDNAECTLLGINTPKATDDKQLTIVPNPASDSFRVELPAPNNAAGNIVVYDVTGHELKRIPVQVGQQQTTIATAGFAKGNYLVVWQSKTDRLIGHLVIVK